MYVCSGIEPVKLQKVAGAWSWGLCPGWVFAGCKPLAARYLMKTGLHHLVETFQKWLSEVCQVEWESQVGLHLGHPVVALTALISNIKGCTAFGEDRVMKARQNFPARNLVLRFAKVWLF